MALIRPKLLRACSLFPLMPLPAPIFPHMPRPGDPMIWGPNGEQDESVPAEPTVARTDFEGNQMCPLGSQTRHSFPKFHGMPNTADVQMNSFGYVLSM